MRLLPTVLQYKLESCLARPPLLILLISFFSMLYLSLLVLLWRVTSSLLSSPVAKQCLRLRRGMFKQQFPSASEPYHPMLCPSPFQSLAYPSHAFLVHQFQHFTTQCYIVSFSNPSTILSGPSFLYDLTTILLCFARPPTSKAYHPLSCPSPFNIPPSFCQPQIALRSHHHPLML